MHYFGTPDLLDEVEVASPGSPVVPLLGRASTFAFPSRAAMLEAINGSTGHVYPRYGHRNGIQLEARMARLEGAQGSVSFSSGMAALSSMFLALLGRGAGLLLSNRCYGGTLDFVNKDLTRLGIRVMFFDPFQAGSLACALETKPALVHVESPVNPTLRILDLPRIAKEVHASGAKLSVDATFIPPPFQRTLELGCDLAVHSATKYLGGHSDILAGICSGTVEDMVLVEGYRRRSGATLSSDSAWMLLRSLMTLDLRVRAQCKTAKSLALYLAQNKSSLGITKLNYPGLPEHEDRHIVERDLELPGAMISLEVDGGFERAVRVYDSLELFKRAGSLGGVESLACLPADTSHAHCSEEEMNKAGFGKGTLRFSVGLESADALQEDMRRALRGT